MITKVYSKVTAAALIAVVGFGLSACGTNDTTTIAQHTPTTSSSSTPTPTQKAELKAFIEVTQHGSIVYSVKDTDSLPPAKGGKYVLTVGDWSESYEHSYGEVKPAVAPGNYTATLTYTGADGQTLTATTRYSIKKVEFTELVVPPISGPVGETWSVDIKVNANPKVTGDIVITHEDGTEFARGTIGKNNTATITMPVLNEGIQELMIVSYSGDDVNKPAKKEVYVAYS